MTLQANLSLDSRVEEIRRARQWVTAHARAAGLSDTEIRNVGLALSEACANVIKHAYRGQPNHCIELQLNIDDVRLELTIRDTGTKFDLASYQSPNLNEPQESGYGIFIIRSLMDEVDYDTSTEQGTMLRLVKYRSGPAV